MKKTLAFLLALIITVTMLPMSVFAAEKPTFTVTSASGKAGDEVTVAVEIANNPGIWSMNYGIEYDTTRLEKVEYTSGGMDGKGTWTIIEKILWDNSTFDNSTYNGETVVLKFKIKEDAPAGDAEIKIKDFFACNSDGNIINADFVAGKVTVAEKLETLIPFTKANHTDSGAHIHEKYSGIVGLKVEGIKVADWTEWQQGFNYQNQGITIYVDSASKDDTATLSLVLKEGQAGSGSIIDAPATVKLNNGEGSFTASYMKIGTGGLAPMLHIPITFKLACTEHDWAEATCTAPKTCTVCGITEGEALGHTWNEGTVTEPTCTSTGVKSFECTVEGCDGTKTETIAALGHQFVDGTCKNCGIAIPFTIKNGDTTLVPTQKESINCKIAKTDVAVFDVIVPADATSIDFSGASFLLYSISDNGNHTVMVSNKTSFTVNLTNGLPKLCYRDILSKTLYHINLIECTSHVWADATCEAPKTCTVCGATEGEALGHSWVDATCSAPKTCSACGATEGEPNPDAHDWDEGKVTTEPTCSEVGVKTFTCKHNAEHTYTDDIAIDADAHAWTVSYVWSEDGKSCTATRVCGNSAEHNVTAEATVTSVVAKKANCSVMGDTQYTATFAADCDWAETQYTVRTDIAIDKNAHEWGEWKVVTEPDYVNEGLEKRVCKLSDEHFEEKAIEKLIPTATEKVDGYDVAYQEGVVIVPEDSDVTVQDIKDALTDKVEKGSLKGEVVVTFMEATIGYIDNNNNFVPIDSNEYFKDGKTIDITLPYPKDGDADKNDNFEVYHYLDDGSIDKCVIKEKNDKGLVIEVGHLSPFVIAYQGVSNVPSKPSRPVKPSDKDVITIVIPEEKAEESNPNTGAPVLYSFDLTAAGVVVLAATAAVLEIKRRK